MRAKRQVTTALNNRNGPNTTSVQELDLNSDVLVWREGNTGQAGTWKGPYKLVSTDGESCILALPNGNTTFRSTSVKPYYTTRAQVDSCQPVKPYYAIRDQVDNCQLSPYTSRDNQDHDTIVVQTPENPVPVQPVKRPRGRPRKRPAKADLTIYLQEDTTYTASRQTEVTGLLEKGVFQPVNKSTIPKGIRIFQSRFVDEIKHQGDRKSVV